MQTKANRISAIGHLTATRRLWICRLAMAVHRKQNIGMARPLELTIAGRGRLHNINRHYIRALLSKERLRSNKLDRHALLQQTRSRNSTRKSDPRRSEQSSQRREHLQRRSLEHVHQLETHTSHHRNSRWSFSYVCTDGIRPAIRWQLGLWTTQSECYDVYWAFHWALLNYILGIPSG